MTERASQAGVRPSLVAAVYLVLIESDRVLLARRKNTGYADGMYSLVAGHVESGETLTVAMIREAREEAGISIEASELTLAHTLHRAGESRIDFFFTVRRWGGVIEIREPDKCDDLSWFRLRDLPGTTLPYIRQAIESIESGLIYSESK